MKITTKITILEIAGTLIIALFIFLGVHFTLESRQVDGTSMEPSLYTGQRVLVCKAAYWFGDPHRGDVIVFRMPGDSDRVLIKRIIGLPGDRLEISEGHVYIGDEILEEPYINEQSNAAHSSVEVPMGYYFVMGDNRGSSSDSRNWGPVPRENIIGKAWLCYWPLSAWHLVSGYSYR